VLIRYLLVNEKMKTLCFALILSLVSIAVNYAEEVCYTVTQPPKPQGANCADIQKKNPGSKSGLYWITVPGIDKPVHVYCDMDTGCGGWTVFQRRKDGSVAFNRTWIEYASGFGNLDGEFWLGNDVISGLTSNKTAQIRFDMKSVDGTYKFAVYNDFKVGNAASKYLLTFNTCYFGTAGDSFSSHDKMKFTTIDQDNDLDSNNNVAVLFHGGWWYTGGHTINPNGQYNNVKYAEGLSWKDWIGFYQSLAFSEMKIRPSDD